MADQQEQIRDGVERTLWDQIPNDSPMYQKIDGMVRNAVESIAPLLWCKPINQVTDQELYEYDITNRLFVLYHGAMCSALSYNEVLLSLTPPAMKPIQRL